MFSLVALAGPAFAQTASVPSGGTFVAGQGQIGVSGNILSIDQSTARAVIDWTDFSIAKDHSVLINNASGATLNRVMSGQISNIQGLLSATGSVYLMNPNGVVVGPGGRILTGGSFVASTRSVDMDAFMRGGPLMASGTSNGSIINQGSIVSTSGSVVLIGRSVSNSGTIEAASGQVSLAAADDVLMTTTDSSANNIYVSVSGDGGDISQDGRITAASVALKAAGGNIYALAGNRDSLIQATGTETIDGQLWLTASNGHVEVSGTVAARNADSGGLIQINGQTVRVASSAHMSAAEAKGGEVVIGVDGFGRGQGLAAQTVIETGATILAGGPSGAGRIETSGKTLDLGAATILAGAGGQWLVDPDDLTIDASAATTMITALDAGTNVSQATTLAATGGSGDITVAAPIVWTGTGNLTLNAYRDLTVNSTISGGGSTTLIAGRNAAVNAAMSGTAVAITAVNQVSLGAVGSIATTGDITLSGATFSNSGGSNALASSGGRWLVYSADPAGDSTGGLTPSFIQYNAPANTTPAAAGNGLLYSIAPNVSVALGSVSKSYDGTLTATLDNNNTNVTGLINGDDWHLDGAFGSKDAGTGLTVTATNFSATNNGIAVYGYTVTTPSVSVTTGTINQAFLTASIVGTPTKTYNKTTTAALSAANYAFTGLADGESITVTQASSVAYDSADAGARTVSATFTSTNFAAGAGTKLSNYVLPVSATGAGYIHRAALRVTDVVANDKTYNRSTAASLNTTNAALYGIIGGDDVHLDTSGAAGTFASMNAGNDISVYASGFTLTGTAADNYQIFQPTGLMASISRAGVTIGGVTVADKVYDGTATASMTTSGAYLTGVLSGDTVTLSTGSATAAFSNRNAGTNIGITTSGFSLSGADRDNYSLNTSLGLTADITPKALSLTMTGTPTKVYNGLTTAIIDAWDYSLTGFITGEGAVISQTSEASYASKNAGSQGVTATIAVSDYRANPGTLLSNYALPTSVTGTGVITPAPITLLIDGNPTKTYDGTTAAALTSGNFQLSGFIAGEGASVTQTSGTYSSANAGIRTVTASISADDLTPAGGTLLSNYSFPAVASGVGTITPAHVTGGIYAGITGNPTKTYDGTTVATLTSSNFFLTGFAPGEGATVTQTVGAYGDKNAGTQAVSASLSLGDFAPDPGTNLANYILPDSAYGTGTIEKATVLAAVIGTPTKVYNGTDIAELTAGNYSFSGFAAGEGVSVASGLDITYDSKNAGARTVTANFAATSLIADSGTLLSNYILPTSASGAGEITRAPLTVIGAVASNKTYDTTTTAALNLSRAALFGVVASDDVTLDASGVTADFADRNVANGISVTATGFAIGGGDVANYELFQPSGFSANITRKSVSLNTVVANDKFYDNTTAATLDTSATTLSGVLGSDDVAFDDTGVTARFGQVSVGTDLKVTASGFILTGADANNYSLSQPSGLKADINRAILTATIIGNPTKTYDGSTSTTLTAANYSLSGFVAGQGATVPQNATAQFDSADAGSRTVSATLVSSDFLANSGTDLSNYVLPTVGTGAGTIDKAILTASITGNPSKVYDSTTNATLTSANYLLKGFIGSQGASVTQTSGVYSSKNAGSRTVTATLSSGDFSADGGTNLDNYVLPVTASGVGSISKASLGVIGVAANSKTYDGNRTAGLDTTGVDLSGVINLDDVSVVSMGASGQFASRNVGTGIGVTATGFTLTGTDAGNYNLTQPAGLSADITQATLSLASVERVYTAGTDVAGSTYTLTGVVSGDTVTVDASGITGAFADRNVGTGISVSLTGLALGGAQAGNYTIGSSISNELIGVITRAPLTVSGIAINTKTYDKLTAATFASTGTLAGLLGSDDVTLSDLGATAVFTTASAGINKAVTASGYSISGGDIGNYTFTQPTGVTGTIDRKAVSLASVTKTYNGNTSNAGAAYTLSGVLAGDTVTVSAATNASAFADKNAAGSLSGGVVSNGIAITLSGLSLGGAAASNYSILPTVSGELIGVINKKSLSASIIGTPTKTYDRTTAATLTSGNFALSGLISGESITVTKTSGTYASQNAGSRTVSTTLTGSDFTANGSTLLSNYTLPVSASGAGLINKATLTIADVTANNKAYDGTTDATLNTAAATLNGVVSGDSITLNSGGATGVFASADTGAHIAVTASGFTISNDTNSNYILTQPTGLFGDIGTAMLTLTKVSRVYTAGLGLPAASAAYTLDGIVAGDVVTVDPTNITGSYASKTVGAGIGVTLSGLGLSGAQASNYTINSSVTNALIGEITPATVSLTGIIANSKTYDGTTALTLDNAAAAISGRLGSDDLTIDASAAAAAFSSANAGSYTISASGYLLDGADAGNYILTQPTGLSATINKATLNAVITGTPTKTYDGNTNATLTSGNYQLTGFVGGQGATVTKTSGVFDSANAGARTVSVTLAGSDFTANGGTLLSNYTLPVSASGTGQIDKATLTAAIIGTPTKTYDGTAAAALTSANFSLSGFVTGEGATITETSGLYASANAGSRAVTVALDSSDFLQNTGTLLSNYVLPTTATGAGQIDKATLIATLTGASKTYNGTTAATLTNANFSLSGFVTGEGASVTKTSGVYASANAGVRVVSTSLVSGDFAADSGTLLSNYVLPTTAAGTGQIDQATLTVTLTGVSKTYDGTTAAALTNANFSLSGFVSGEGATVTKTAGIYDSANAGARTVSTALVGGDFMATGSTLLANYVLPVSASGAATINKATLTAAIIGNPLKVYDGTADATLTNANFSLSGFVSGEGATVTQTAGAYDSANAGTRTVSASLASGDFTADSGTLLSNYTLPVSATGAGQIDKATLTATLTGVSKTYDGTAAATLTDANFSLSGFVTGEGANVTQTAGSYDSANAGTRTVSANLASGDFTADSGTLLSNYTLPVSASGSAMIDKAVLTAAIIGAPQKVYDGTTDATLTDANFSLLGFVSGEGATVTQTAGAYDSANAGVRTVSASLTGVDFTATGGTLLSNYVLPVSATGAGHIDKATLTANLTGVSKTYDGTTAAALTNANFALSGFVSGEGATVTQTAGSYDSANAGTRTIAVALASGDFTATGGTLLSNYTLPVSASGTGQIDKAALTAAIIGTPTKTYDGAASATLNNANYALSGFVTGEGADVTQTVGSFDSANAGTRTVTASLASGDIAAHDGTLLSNYVLPVSATGAGQIEKAALSVAIIGTASKIYDGTTKVSLIASDYALTGFISGEGASVTQTTGAFDSANAGTRAVSATLSDADFAASGTTLLSNYALPTVASGAGQVDRAILHAGLTGVSKTYDGSATAALTNANFVLTGFIAGEGASVSRTDGLFDSANAGTRAVSTALASGDFIATGGTLLSNYVLPVSASGTGQINQATLTAAIIGTPAKTYDGTTAAALTAGNFILSGFITGEGASITQTAGTYNSANAGTRIVSASLASGDFTADSGTLLSNYVLPVSVTGAGLIDKATLTATLTGVAKTYDGTTSAVLTDANFALSGFITGEGAAVTQTTGFYASANTGAHAISASLASSDFAVAGGTLLSNYILPVFATGTGQIDKAVLTAAIIGMPNKTYDGSATAALTNANFVLTGFVAGEGASVSRTDGLFDSANAGTRAVSTALAAGDFTATGSTLLSNYVLPVSASGTGQIDQALLTAAIIGMPNKTYDGSATAALTNANFVLSGFVAGEGASVSRTDGLFDSANAGTRAVSTTLASGDFIATGGTLLSNYALPVSASGTGQIDRKSLSVALIGMPTKTYDGTAAAPVTTANFAIEGFVAGEGASITTTTGLFDAPDAGERFVTVVLGTGDVTATGSTLLSNYVLPGSVTGNGRIDQAVLTAALGDVSKSYDGNADAVLTSANFTLSGFVAGEGAKITKTAGLFDSATVGARTVSTDLAAGDFAANEGTSLSNYVLPVSASGEGRIQAVTMDLASVTARALAGETPVTEDQHMVALRISYVAANPRTYIPYPAPGALSTWRTNGFASLPSIMAPADTSGAQTFDGGLPVINSTEQILLQGDKSKQWRIDYTPLTATADFIQVQP